MTDYNYFFKREQIFKAFSYGQVGSAIDNDIFEAFLLEYGRNAAETRSGESAEIMRR